MIKLRLKCRHLATISGTGVRSARHETEALSNERPHKCIRRIKRSLVLRHVTRNTDLTRSWFQLAFERRFRWWTNSEPPSFYSWEMHLTENA